MKRKKQRNRTKFLTALLLAGSLAGIGMCLVHMVPYVQEEMQSASLQLELAALHEKGAENVAIANNQSAAPIGMEADTKTPSAGQPDMVKAAGLTGLPCDDPTEEAEMSEELSHENAEEGQSSHNGLAALHQKNADCIAWITIDGTVIDYPVMYRPQSKNYYIHRDFYGRRSSSGSLYVSEICDPDACDNLIIYGHHMSSGSMFAALDRYKKKSFYEAHPTIQLERLSGVETYEIIFALTTPVYTKNDFKYYAFARAADEQEFSAYIAGCQARALYDTGKTASYGDKLLTLSTCEYSQKNGRMVVVAKRIDP